MATHTVAQAKYGVAGLLSGTNLDNVTALNNAFERAARTLCQRADIPEASGRQSVTLYDGVYDYLAPTTIFGTALVDLRMQGVSRTPWEYPYKLPIVGFDRTKNIMPSGAEVTFEFKKGTGIMRVVSSRTTPRAVLDGMTVDDGWVAAGSASGLVEDQTAFYTYPASLRFTLTSSSTGTLTKTISQIDISDYEDVGVAFLAIRIPDGATASQLTSIALRLGNSSTVYDEVSDTDGFLGAWTVGDWLLVALDFSTATSTGTPDWDEIDYVQVRLSHAATLTNFRVGGLWISLPSPHEVLFQSTAIFMATGANPLQTIANDEDTIILNDAAYNIYEHEVALTVLLQGAATKMSLKAMEIKKLLNGEGNEPGLYALYRSDNPSQELRETVNWYE